VTTEVPAGHSAVSVFVNCPFDAEFRPQLNAIVFTRVHAGFYPVLASSSGQSGRPRLERILGALNDCRYSIHDLSRCRGEGDDNLARFNMPLELGMAMAIRGGSAAAERHEFLVLVPQEHYLHKRYISDLGGLDPQTHDGTPPRIVAEVLAWLLTAAEAPAELSPPEVLEKLPRFEAELDALDEIWRGGSPPWPKVVEAAARVARNG
jgi:hypothetical protein